VADTQGVDLKGPHRELAIASGRLLGYWLRRLGLSFRDTEQEFGRARVVFILDLAYNVFKDVPQSSNVMSARAFPSSFRTRVIGRWTLRNRCGAAASSSGFGKRGRYGSSGTVSSTRGLD
jgi:hypothetical protein